MNINEFEELEKFKKHVIDNYKEQLVSKILKLQYSDYNLPRNGNMGIIADSEDNGFAYALKKVISIL